MAKNDILASMLVRITANSTQFLAEMAKANAGTAKFQSSVIAAGKSLVAGFGAYQVIGAIRSAIGVIADFEVQMSTVKAITGATGDQFKELEKNALDLGRSTRYTATQVGSLQVEFGRLGFSSKEIINATKATLNLATASGSDLARSAEIAGSTLRAFQIDAKDMSRVTDVMAAGFNTSALGLDNFAESIKYVSPVAKAVNVSLEETTAMLAVLADAGIKGSQAGTSLRRIFTQLTADGRPLAERMGELAAKGITLADANDEVGLYAQTALLVLGNQNEKVKELTETYKKANGETQRMADIMEDNLTGDVTKLSSAWEGLILNGKGLSLVLREITQGLTNFVTEISGADARRMLEFEKRLKGISNNLNELKITENSPRIRSLIDEAKELGVELHIAKNELNQVTGIYKIVRSGLVGPQSSGGNVAMEIGSKLFSDYQQKRIQDYLKEREIQLQILKDTYERVQLERSISDALKARIEDTSKTRSDLMSQFGIGGDGKSFDASDPMGYVFEPSDMEEQVSFYEEMGETIEQFTERILKNKQATEQSQLAWLNFSSSVADSIANVIKSDESLGKSIAKVTASVLNAAEQRIAAYLGEGIAKAFAINPVAGIAIATIGLGVIRGLLSKVGMGRGGAGGGMSSGRVNNEVYGGGVSGLQNSTPNITGVIRGEDLWVVLQNYQRNNKYTSALG